MAGTFCAQGPRLAILLRRLGLCPASVAQQEKKLAVAAVKTAYYKLAKEEHPDVAAHGKEDEAKDRFVILHDHCEEAIKLLEAGVRPAVLDGASYPSAHDDIPPAGETRQYQAPDWSRMQHFKHREEPKFDLYTRIKGHLVLWGGLFFFLSGLREFLVWSAGSTYAWSPPSDFNPFWVRRFKTEWAEENREKIAVVAKEKAKPRVVVEEKLYRNIDTFYQKRGISNVRKKTQPRGHGVSL